MVQVFREDRNHRNRRTRDWHRNNPCRSYWLAAKKRANEQNVSFGLEESDIVFPERCPVLGIPIILLETDGPRKRTDNTPSLDRIIPALGYVKDNVSIISWRANSLKSNGKLEDFEKIVQYLKKELTEG